eukprot:4984014-Prymnesium_polylepis.2
MQFTKAQFLWRSCVDFAAFDRLRDILLKTSIAQTETVCVAAALAPAKGGGKVPVTVRRRSVRREACESSDHQTMGCHW